MWTILTGVALAGPGYTLWDAGRSIEGATTAVIVATPGVRTEAYLPWVEALELQDLDAWVVSFPAAGQDTDGVVTALRHAWEELDGSQDAVLAAHGYGGVFALLAGLEPGRMALVAVPLGAHPVELALGKAPAVVAEELPLSELLGDLPMEPYSASLDAAYRRWTVHFPDLSPPGCPVLLVASGLDPIAPPEVVRLPTQDWPEREWMRAGPLGLDPKVFTHAELLADRRMAERVARWLAS